jgi:hypothetical protein
VTKLPAVFLFDSVIVTVAPGKGCPVASVTVPTIVPVVTCARAAAGERRMRPSHARQEVMTARSHGVSPRAIDGRLPLLPAERDGTVAEAPQVATIAINEKWRESAIV